MAKTVDITYFCDTVATIRSKSYQSDGAGGFTMSPQYVNIVSGYLQPITGGQVVSAGQMVIDATHQFFTAQTTLAMNGDIATIGTDDYTISYFEEPANVQLGSYFCLYLKIVHN